MGNVKLLLIVIAVSVLLALTACELEYTPIDDGGTIPNADEVGTVTNIIDGDTIDVNINGTIERIRYVGVNTPERDEPCYTDAKNANAALLPIGQTVSLVKDTSETDRYGRLLRYVYVGSTFVNEELVRGGYAEAVLYEPDNAQFDHFVSLEAEAARAGRGCHPTGIFDDGNTER